MDSQEIYKELSMSYYELSNYLVEKYGPAICDYFRNSNCASKNPKISRTSDGLYCHHVDEDKGGNLQEPCYAKAQPWAWQKKERLVYCNILEHFILHLKILILRQKKRFVKPKDCFSFFSTGGLFMITKEINDLFVNNGSPVAWKNRCFVEIKQNYHDYIIIIRAVLEYLVKNYVGTKDVSDSLGIGKQLHLFGEPFIISKISAGKDVILLRNSEGVEHSRMTYGMSLSFKDTIDIIARKLSSGYDSFFKKIYVDTLECNINLASDYVDLLNIDFHGFGFLQYADILLGDEYQAFNADEYIAKALPMFCDNKVNFSQLTPKFWKGKSLPKALYNHFFIVRIKTSFVVKPEYEPFVRYRENDLQRRPTGYPSEYSNFIDYGWTVLKTSDLFNRESGQYCNTIRNKDGTTSKIEVVLTLGRDDYYLFRERYRIFSMEILDGCYFASC